MERLRNDSKVTFNDVHGTKAFRLKLIEALQGEVEKACICSPYFDKMPAPFYSIVKFCRFLRTRGVSTIEIITRPPGADLQSLTAEDAKLLANDGVEIFIRQKPYLHSKLFYLEYKAGYFRTFIGSANCTIGGFERNDELMAEVVGRGDGTACHREMLRLRDLGSLPYEAWNFRNETPKNTRLN